MRHRLMAAIACGLMAGCGGGGSNLTGPSNSIPNVAGNYSGSTTMVFPEISQTLNCTTTTSVTQSGTTVTIAPLILGGACGGLSIPVGQVTIDATGSMNFGNGSFSFSDPSCGSYSGFGSGGFFGRDMRISLNATSRTCYNFNMTVNVTH